MAELIVALDYPQLSPALSLTDQLLEQLQGRVSWFKVGLELFSSHGPEAVRSLRSLGARVFLDLKLLDIPNTVFAAARAATEMGVGMFTVHLSGGSRMTQAAIQGRNQGRTPGADLPLIVGVTLLTSLERKDIAWMGDHDPESLVLRLADEGNQWGINGVVCSAHEVGPVKRLTRPSFICVTPGIRISAANDDQARTADPGTAVAAGSDFLVVGRPITAASDPIKSAAAFLAAMESPFQGDA